MFPRQRMAFSQVIYTSGFLVLAVVLAIVAVGALTMRFVAAPQTLRVAVAPEDNADAKLVEAIARRLEQDSIRLRLTAVPVASAGESAKTLDDGRADLAVVRSDGAVPSNGTTVLILHTDAALLVAPAGSTIAKMSDLAKKRVGLYPGTAANAALLDALLAEFDIARETVQHVMLSAEDLARVMPQKRVDAVLAVGPLRGSALETVVAALAARGRAPVLIPIDEVEGIAARGAAIQKIDIPAGYFHGSPPYPKESLTTASVAVRLEARQRLSEEIVTELTRRIFVMRRALQSEAPIAAALERPDTDDGSADGIHPGAAAFYDNNEKSFLDRYGDFIYIGAMAFSGIGSAVAALFGITRTRARRAALTLIDELIELKRQAHLSMELPRLAEFEIEIEDLSTRGLRFARDNNFDDAGLSALRLAIDEARRAINDQRKELEAKTLLIEDAHFQRAEG